MGVDHSEQQALPAFDPPPPPYPRLNWRLRLANNAWSLRGVCVTVGMRVGVRVGVVVANTPVDPAIPSAIESINKIVAMASPNKMVNFLLNRVIVLCSLLITPHAQAILNLFYSSSGAHQSRALFYIKACARSSFGEFRRLCIQYQH